MSRDEISVLSTAEAIRRRPEMYAGDINDPNTLVRLVVEAMCLARAQACEGLCTKIEITLLPEGFVRVEDNGHGAKLSLDENGVSAMDRILTELYACRDLKGGHDHFCKIGLVAVVALSSSFSAWARRGEVLYSRAFQFGSPVEALFTPLSQDGTVFEFRPDPIIYRDHGIDEGLLRTQIAAIATDCPAEVGYWDRRGRADDPITRSK